MLKEPKWCTSRGSAAEKLRWEQQTGMGPGVLFRVVGREKTVLGERGCFLKLREFGILKF